MDTDDLMCCKHCGVYFNVYIVKSENIEYSTNILYTCPVCKKKTEVWVE